MSESFYFSNNETSNQQQDKRNMERHRTKSAHTSQHRAQHTNMVNKTCYVREAMIFLHHGTQKNHKSRNELKKKKNELKLKCISAEINMD